MEEPGIVLVGVVSKRRRPLPPCTGHFRVTNCLHSCIGFILGLAFVGGRMGTAIFRTPSLLKLDRICSPSWCHFAFILHEWRWLFRPLSLLRGSACIISSFSTSFNWAHGIRANLRINPCWLSFNDFNMVNVIIRIILTRIIHVCIIVVDLFHTRYSMIYIIYLLYSYNLINITL